MLLPPEPPPPLIAEAGPIIRAAVAEAARFALDNRDALAVVEVEAGAGKTREALVVAALLAAEGYRVVFALPGSRGVVAEKAGELAQLIADGVACNVPVELAAGALRDGADGCRVWSEATEPTRDRFERIFARDGRAVCNGCAFRQGCKAAETPKAAPGVVTVAAHANAAFLARGAHDGPPDAAPVVVFYDESPELVTGTEVTRAHLATLATARAGANWRADNPGAVADAVALARALDTMGRDEAEAADRRPVAIDPVRPLTALLEARPGGLPYLDPDGEGWGAGARAAKDPPWPDPATARRDGGAEWADREAWRTVQALDARDPMVRVMFKAEGWTVERRRAWTPPEGAAVVVLSATPNMIGLGKVAEMAGRTVRAWTVDVVGVGPRLALHLDCPRFANVRLRKRGGVELKAAARKAFGMINRALPADWQARGAEGRPVVVGILTHKVMADPLRGPAPGPKGAREWAELVARQPEAVAVAALATEAAAAGIRLEIGHHGADGVASNRFARVDVYVVAGAPRTHKEAALFDAKWVLGLDDAGALDYLAREDAGAAVQALARARSSRPDREGGPPALIWCDRPPPPVPGGWVVVPPAAQGSPNLAKLARPGAAQPPTAAELEARARDLADRWQAIAHAALIAEAAAYGVELKRDRAEALATAEGRRRGWHAFRVATGGKGRPVTVYAANQPRADALAAWTRTETAATWTNAAGAGWGALEKSSSSDTDAPKPATTPSDPAAASMPAPRPTARAVVADRDGGGTVAAPSMPAVVAAPAADVRAAAVVEAARPLAEAGASWEAIGKALNAARVPAPGGILWQTATVARYCRAAGLDRTPTEAEAARVALADAAEALVSRYLADDARPLDWRPDPAVRAATVAAVRAALADGHAPADLWAAWTWLRDSPAHAKGRRLKACRTLAYAVNRRNVAALIAEAGALQDKAQ